MEDRIALKAREELSQKFPGQLFNFWDKGSSDNAFKKNFINQMKIRVKNAYGSSINLSDMSCRRRFSYFGNLGNFIRSKTTLNKDLTIWFFLILK